VCTHVCIIDIYPQKGEKKKIRKENPVENVREGARERERERERGRKFPLQDLNWEEETNLDPQGHKEIVLPTIRTKWFFLLSSSCVLHCYYSIDMA
jgi:hypothetical protein